MKVCNVIELKTPTQPQMKTLISHIFPTLPIEKQETVKNYAMGDLRKLEFIKKLCEKKPELIEANNFMMHEKHWNYQKYIE